MNRPQWNSLQPFYPNPPPVNFPQLPQYPQNPNQNKSQLHNQIHLQQNNLFRSNPNRMQQQHQQQQQNLSQQNSNLIINQQPNNPQKHHLSRILPIGFLVPYPQNMQQQAQNQNHQFWKEIENKQNKKISTVPSSQLKQNFQQQKKKKRNNKQKQTQKQKHLQQQPRKRKPNKFFNHPKYMKKKNPMPRRRNQKKNHKFKKQKNCSHLLNNNSLTINSPNVDLKEKNKYRLSAPKNSTSRLIPRKGRMILRRSDSTSGFFIDENGSFETLIDSSIFDSPLIKTILDENIDVDEKKLKEKVYQTDQFQEQLKEIKSKNLYHRMLLNYIKTLRNQNEELGSKLITVTDELLELQKDNNKEEQDNCTENEYDNQNKLENKLKNEIEIKNSNNIKKGKGKEEKKREEKRGEGEEYDDEGEEEEEEE
ncbi:cleavage stimulation factor 3' pre-RNA subunit [Anaeramoeba flamelloides]|uniref:Cleavage stimulation factor 3' pre-RNA subunit n=1 Tax=Anaeramoeba flamelloides TaxID=1746091 RepID=A0AAV7Y6R8_9EUKA|nr:cleavage stimulation factor 3' pre-RNA subunit [Anaeramoeba flamelloides]